MRYVILIYHNKQAQDVWETLSEAERGARIHAHVDLVNDLVDSSEMVLSEALTDPSQGKRVLVRDGATSTTDGPFAEVKEHLAGFYLVECDTIERAIELAARIPESTLGTVEVRPVMTQAVSDL